MKHKKGKPIPSFEERVAHYIEIGLVTDASQVRDATDPDFRLCSQEHFDRVWGEVVQRNARWQMAELEAAEAENSEGHAPTP